MDSEQKGDDEEDKEINEDIKKWNLNDVPNFSPAGGATGGHEQGEEFPMLQSLPGRLSHKCLLADQVLRTCPKVFPLVDQVESGSKHWSSLG